MIFIVSLYILIKNTQVLKEASKKKTNMTLNLIDKLMYVIIIIFLLIYKILAEYV